MVLYKENDERKRRYFSLNVYNTTLVYYSKRHIGRFENILLELLLKWTSLNNYLILRNVQCRDVKRYGAPI